MTARDAVHLVLTIGLLAALIRWGMLERRAPPADGWPERLANRLKERRIELGLTQAELAEKVGVTRKTVNTVDLAIPREVGRGSSCRLILMLCNRRFLLRAARFAISQRRTPANRSLAALGSG